jgi:methylated-DNA-[protein]-cysteine S-methyltransferase
VGGIARIPLGETRSYGEIARAIGQPNAQRAVGHACATNPVPLIVPCHRVVRATASSAAGLGPQRAKAVEREGARK